MSDYLGQTVTKQFSNSPTLLALLEDFDQWVDMKKFSDEFLAYVWDISTAQGFGLDIWGRILGRSRYIEIAQTPGDNFGFDAHPTTGQTNWKPWNQAPFYNSDSAGNVTYALQDDYYRRLLLIKAAANIAACNTPALNTLLRDMFGDRGPCFVGYDLDFPMHIGYFFRFMPTAVEKSIIESGLFPAPAGMTVTFIYNSLTFSPFGFAQSNTGSLPDYVTGWNQGPFYTAS